MEIRPVSFHRVLVPVNGSKVDEDALRLACSLAKKGRAQVYVLYVIKMGWTLPLEAESKAEVQQGEVALAHAEEVADELDYQVETELLQAREVGPAIVDEAVERGVDVVVMGLSYKKQFGEFSLGTIVPYVIRNAPCSVILFREPAALPLEGTL